MPVQPRLILDTPLMRDLFIEAINSKAGTGLAYWAGCDEMKDPYFKNIVILLDRFNRLNDPSYNPPRCSSISPFLMSSCILISGNVTALAQDLADAGKAPAAQETDRKLIEDDLIKNVASVVYSYGQASYHFKSLAIAFLEGGKSLYHSMHGGEQINALKEIERYETFIKANLEAAEEEATRIGTLKEPSLVQTSSKPSPRNT